MNKKNENKIERPPVVAIMGHVDHGKSTLLDYIQKTNIVENESGGITQHLSAYEVEFDDGKKITFIDTPGHAAFDAMRDRSGALADIAILIISAEDGIKEQTKHAIQVIKKYKIPFIVAINKIDKENANPEKVKTDLLEEEIYLEGFGGDVPYAEISAKTGKGVDELLQLILLLAEMEEMKGDLNKNASGFVVESTRDPKKGISATLIIKDGTIKKGQFIVVEDSMSSTRMLRDFKGKNIDSARFSSPVQISGFDRMPVVGTRFETYDTKKEAQKVSEEFKRMKDEIAEKKQLIPEVPEDVALIPIILKTDVVGTADAIEKEILKKSDERVIFKIIRSEAGNINESDIKLALTDSRTVIIGFHTNEDIHLKNVSGYAQVQIHLFDVIYHLSEWLDILYEERRIKQEVRVPHGKLKVLKLFSRKKTQTLLGGEIQEGTIYLNDEFIIFRKEEEIGFGKILGLQEGKMNREKVEGKGTQCGILAESKEEIKEGDLIQVFTREIR